MSNKHDDPLDKEIDLDGLKPGKKTAMNADDLKVKKTIRLDYEVFEWLLVESKKHGLPYQTYMNMLLTRIKNQDSLEERVARLEKTIDILKAG